MTLKVILFILTNLLFVQRNVRSIFFFKNPAFTFIFCMYIPTILSIIFAMTDKEKLTFYFPFNFKSWKENVIAMFVPIIVTSIVLALGLSMGYMNYRGVYEKSIIANLIFFIITAMGEELAWRGYLYKKLENLKHSPLIVGIVWVLWHFVQNSYLKFITLPNLITKISFACLVILMSYFLSYLRKKSNSLLPPILFHGVWNFLAFSYIFSDNGIAIFNVSNEYAKMENVLGFLVSLPLLIIFVFKWYYCDKRA